MLGVPLEPGERVIWFKEHSHTVEKVMMIILGVLFLVILIGLLFIWMGVTADKRNPRAHAITNRRLIFWPGKGGPQFYPVSQIVDVEPERQRAHGGGGLLGAAIGAAVTAALDHSANKKEKTSAAYWKRTIAMTVVTQQNQRVQIPLGPGYGAQFGELTARIVFNREGDSLPAVPFKA